MKPALIAAFAASLALLSACTPPTQYADAKKGQLAEPPIQRERQAFLERTAAEPVHCSVGPDCTDKWARALEWVKIHASYSVISSTPTEIKTAGPIEPTTDSAFSVTMTQETPNTGTINFSSTCGKTPICSPTTLELHSQFNAYLLNGG